jgi:dehydrogenase/reductase SDR family member 12
VAAIRESAPGADVRALTCDLSSLAGVKSFAEAFAAREPRLDVLVNNAGVMPLERTRSVDGHELMFATHVLAPVALVSELSDLLARSAPARVINVGSGGMYGQSLPVGDWESTDTEYGPTKLYARTKREQLAVTEVMADRLRDRGVFVHAMHPGWADTEGLRRSMRTFQVITGPIIRTADEGADTIVWLGASAEPVREAGLLWHDRRPRPTHYRLGAKAGSMRDREELWAYCEAALAAVGIAAL